MTPDRGSVDPDVAPLIGEGVARSYPAGALLFAEGDPPGPTLVVVTGVVCVATEDVGEIARVGPGELVGEMSALDGLPRSASVVAVSDVEVRAISPGRFAVLLEQHPSTDAHVRSLLHTRRSVGPLMQDPGGSGVPVDRLARWILDQPMDPDDPWLGMSLADMAAALDASRELLSRAIDHLVGRGAVALERGRLLVRSSDILEALAVSGR